MSIPVLETPRLRLRAHRADDLAGCAAMWADPSVTRHISGRVFSAAETWGKILLHAGHWTLMGFGYWVVEEKASGDILFTAGSISVPAWCLAAIIPAGFFLVFLHTMIKTAEAAAELKR